MQNFMSCLSEVYDVGPNNRPRLASATSNLNSMTGVVGLGAYHLGLQAAVESLNHSSIRLSLVAGEGH